MKTVVIGGVKYDLASLSQRWCGQCLDVLVYIALYLVPIFVYSFFIDSIDAAPDSTLARVPGIVFVAPAVLYLVFQDGLLHGRSWGKKAVKTRVIDSRTGRPCSYRQSLIRNLTLVLNVIDTMFIVTSRRQRLGDRLAHTVVVAA